MIPREADLGFLSGIYTLEILPVHDKYHHGDEHRYRDAHPRRAAVAVKNGVGPVEYQRIQQSRHPGRHRHHARTHKHYRKNNDKHEKDRRLGHKDHHSRNEYALSAAEFVKHGEHMSEHTEKTGQIRTDISEPEITEQRGNDRFQNIPAKGQHPCLFAVGAEHIGHSRVARAVRTHVIREKRAGNDDRRAEAPQQISARRAKQDRRDEPQERRHSDNSEALGKKAVKPTRNNSRHKKYPFRERSPDKIINYNYNNYHAKSQHTSCYYYIKMH